MCRSKAEVPPNGRRCVAHLEKAIKLKENALRRMYGGGERQFKTEEEMDEMERERFERDQARLQAKADKLRAEIAELEVALAEAKAYTAEQEQRKAEEKEANEAIKAAQAANDAADVQKRIAEALANGVRVRDYHSLTEGLGFTMTPAEWEQIDAAAAAEGKNLSNFVRARLTEGITVQAEPASAFVHDSEKNTKHEQDKAHGRRPTKDKSTRARRAYQFSKAQIAEIEVGAALYDLSKSDYTRRVLLGIDPRKAEGHFSKETNARREKFFGDKEAAAGFTPDSDGDAIQAFYVKEYADAVTTLRTAEIPAEDEQAAA